MDFERIIPAWRDTSSIQRCHCLVRGVLVELHIRVKQLRSLDRDFSNMLWQFRCGVRLFSITEVFARQTRCAIKPGSLPVWRTPVMAHTSDRVTPFVGGEYRLKSRVFDKRCLGDKFQKEQSGNTWKSTR